jgi:hypothetical protein
MTNDEPLWKTSYVTKLLNAFTDAFKRDIVQTLTDRSAHLELDSNLPFRDIDDKPIIFGYRRGEPVIIGAVCADCIVVECGVDMREVSFDDLSVQTMTEIFKFIEKHRFELSHGFKQE